MTTITRREFAPELLGAAGSTQRRRVLKCALECFAALGVEPPANILAWVEFRGPLGEIRKYRVVGESGLADGKFEGQCAGAALAEAAIENLPLLAAESVANAVYSACLSFSVRAERPWLRKRPVDCAADLRLALEKAADIIDAAGL